MQRLTVFLHLAVAALGLALGFFVPSSWKLPLFFAALGLTVTTVIAAHSYPDSKARSRAGTAAMLFFSLLLVAPGGAIRRGQAPLYFMLALLFTLAYVGGLVLSPHVA